MKCICTYDEQILDSDSYGCDIYVGSKNVGSVTHMRYLGHTVTNGVNGNFFKFVINDFNVKLNTFVAYFNAVACYLCNNAQVFMDLISVYCLTEKIKICILLGGKIYQRYGVYHVWLNVIYYQISLVWCLGRFCLANVFITGYCIKTRMVSMALRSSMCNVSWLGSNIWDVCFKNDIELHSLHTMTIGETNTKNIGKWSENVNDEHQTVGM